MDASENSGQMFSEELLAEIRNRFHHVEVDPLLGERRLFFDNAGGSMRLKAAHDAFKRLDELPDASEHSNRTALWLDEVQKKGIEDIKTIFNADSGSLVTSLTASMVIFEATRTIMENIPGSNVVTTRLEHPSAYDAVMMYAKKFGKEVRVANTNAVTGGVDVEEIARCIDRDTCMLSAIYASNISGAVLDLESIVRECRRIKPDLFIVCDAVQHMPHHSVDLRKTPVDAMNFAPYKFFGPRGIGIGYLSERAAKLPHAKLLAKPEGEWELGSPAPAQYAAVSEIVNYVCWLGGNFIDSANRRDLYVEGMRRINLHERALMHRMLNGSVNAKGLRSLDHVTVFLDHEDLSARDFIIAIGIDNLGHREAVEEYEKEGVIVFERVATSLFSKRMLESFNIEGCVRVSPLHCNCAEEIDGFLLATQRIVNRFNP